MSQFESKNPTTPAATPARDLSDEQMTLDCKTEKNTLGEEKHLGEYEEKANRIESLGTPNDPCDEE